jgi:hypothetical protein
VHLVHDHPTPLVENDWLPTIDPNASGYQNLVSVAAAIQARFGTRPELRLVDGGDDA